MTHHLDLDLVQLPPAPPCVPWCDGHPPNPRNNPRDGWDDAIPVSVHKNCRRTVATVKVADRPGYEFEVYWTRFTHLDWGQGWTDVIIEEPALWMDDTEITMAEAALLAEAFWIAAQGLDQAVPA